MRRLAPLALILGLAGCQSVDQMLAQGGPAAVRTAEARARFEMNCPAAQGSVLSSRSVIPMDMPRAIERAEYTVGVAGCGQRAVYIVGCPLGDPNCVAIRQDRPA
ncbi:hypothetical protein KTR66_07445 [Roseococcus sp. SDR]|uniref:hypothetical protein n=1 Tax=Roseococcus sp. SDR TaxID=2835532 RepID=UPI001BCBFF48|nr:hypothetical protein [Roseococcus sp. SDR]MBS7789822.1 hypothetical protein [Roseococcus sp. SDR]MBV1845136.1 hypothetical protein [Roseococcus sp. SDR]